MSVSNYIELYNIILIQYGGYYYKIVLVHPVLIIYCRTW